MDNVTQQNAALVEQAAAAAQSFDDQARQLQAAVAAFNVGEPELSGGPNEAAQRRSTRPIRLHTAS